MALGPIDYVSGLLPTNDSIVQGLGQGMQLRAAYDQQQLLKQQQAAALAAQQKYEQDKAAALANPTPQAFAALAVNYPQHREAFKQGWDQLNTAQQQGELRDISTIAAALQSGRPDVALSKIDERIAAMKTGGQDTSALTFLRDRIQRDPRQAHGDVLNVLAGLPGGDKVLENLGKIGTEARAAELQAPTVAKAVADASTAQSTAQKTAIDAKYAEQNALKDLEKKGWDIKKIAADIDIAREANRIARMNAETSRTTNDLRRQELDIKVKEARSALDEKIRTRAAEAESAQATTDNFLNTADRVLALAYDPQSKQATSTLRAAAGPLDSRLPTVQGDVADLEAIVETLSSQAFLSQIPMMKGTGNLSEKEGDKLQAALTNLSLKQSPEQFLANVREAQRLVSKVRSNIARRYGIPESPADRPARAPLPSGAAPAAPGASLRSPPADGRPPLDSFFTPGT